MLKILLSLFLISSVYSQTQRYEVKARLESDSIETILKSISPSDFGSRRIFILDTSGKDLKRNGIVVRLRVNEDLSYDLTLKIRELAYKDVDAAFFAFKGFKCETNIAINREYSACSFKVKHHSPVDFNVIHKALTKDQLNFLAQYKPNFQIKFKDLKVKGPVISSEWELTNVEGYLEMNLEYWILPNGTRFLEASSKLPVYDQQNSNRFFEVVKSLGGDVIQDPESRLSNL